MKREAIAQTTIAVLALGWATLLGVGASTPAAAQSIAFGPEHPYSVGASASGVKAGDFDNDGTTDLLVASDGANKLALFPGDGSGGFGTALETSLSASPTSLDVADLNSDGNLDAIIISRPEQQLITRLGQGDGTFGAPTALSVASGAKEFTPLDFDGDSNVDVAYATRNAIYFVEGNGDGSFTSLSSGLTLCGSCSGDEKNGLLSADLNDDGLPDLVAVDGNTRVHVTLNDGGTGDAPYPYPVTTTYSALTTPQDVGVLDLDGDGDLDVVASGGASSANWVTMYNDGTGTLSNTTLGQAAFAWHLATADFDLDGAQDVAFASDTDGVTIARDAGTALSSAGTFTAGTAAYDVATADFNGDRYPDLAVADQSGSDLIVRLNAPTVSWTGGGDGRSWRDAANWSTGTVPTASSNVVIDYDPGSSYVIDVGGTQEVASITQTTSRVNLDVEDQLTVNGAFDHAAGSVSGGGTLTVNGRYTLAPSGFGELLAPATTVLNGGLTWTDGDLSGGGTTIINGASTVQAEDCFSSPVVLDNFRRLELNATLAITAGCISLESGATFVVGPEGTVDFQAADTDIRPVDESTSLPTLINNGTIVKTAGASGASTIGWQSDFFGDERLILQNNGTIRAETGTIRIYYSESSTNSDGLLEMTDGNFTLYRAEDGASTAVDVGGTIQGPGRVRLNGELALSGTIDLSGTLSMRDGQALTEALTINQLNTLRVRTNKFTDAVFAFNAAGAQTVQTLSVQGRMELNTDLTIANRFTFGTGEPSTLTGSGNLTVPAGATMEWGDGRMGGGGTLTVGGTLTSVVAQYLDGDFPTQSSQATLNGRHLVVSGSVVWDDAPLYLNAGATVDVQSGGTFDLQRDGRIEPGDGSTSEEQVINAGTLVKSGVGQRIDSESPFPGPGDGDATTYDTVSYGMPIAVPVTNSGTLSLEAGRTAFTDALDNTGRIQGTDTLDVSTVGAFTNTGTLAPGTSPGTLTVEGPVDLSGTTLAIEALGATPGTGHDQLKATGAVQLGGTLDVTLLDGYDPPGGTSFTLVEAESVAGTFDAVNRPTLSGRTVDVEYQAGSVTLTVTADNTPPTASDDEAQTTEGTAVIIDVLANDTDANGDALAITEVTDPTHGTAAVIDNAVRYTPSDGYTGEDAFTYTVSDGNGGTDEGAVAVTVQATTGTLAGTVTDADSGSPLADASVVIAALDRSTTTGAEGAYTLGGLPDGTYSAEARAPGYQAGTQEVTITAGQATTADFALDPEVTNTPPTAADDAVTTFRGVPVAINVLANDTDADGDPLTIAEVGTPTLGTVSIADAGLQYVPNDGATGTDTFRYVVRDGNGGQAEGTVTVTITAQGFAVTNVGTLGGATSKAVAVDGRGRIVGVSTTERGTARAFVWDDGAIQPLPTPEGDAIQVTAANEAGEVVGAALRDSTSEAFLITAAGASTALGTLGGPFSAAYDINRTGDVVGTAATASQAHHAFRWAGTMNDLGTFGAAHSEAFGINDAGTVVGTATDEDGTTRPFVGTTVLPDAESGRAYAINESEQMVGSQLDGDRVVARTWTSDGTGTTLEGLGGTFAEAYAINDAGWVVGTAAVGAEAAATAKASTAARFRQWRTDPGASWRRGATVGAASSAKLAGDDGSYHAVLWIDGEPRDLNDLILDPGNDWTLIEARHVSGEGQIVGYGRYRGALRAFVLRPTDNAPPQVRNDEHRVTERAPTVLDVLANDIDHDGQPLRITEVLDRPSGTVHLTGDSTAIRYAPAPGFRGSDRFRYRVSDGAGGTAHATVRIDVAVASPARLRLHPNYPNPFRTRTVIRYELPEAAPAQLALYDMLGRRVLMLVDEQQPAGIHEVTMDARTLTSGVYLLRLQAADAVETRRLTIVR